MLVYQIKNNIISHAKEATLEQANQAQLVYSKFLSGSLHSRFESISTKQKSINVLQRVTTTLNSGKKFN